MSDIIWRVNSSNYAKIATLTAEMEQLEELSERYVVLLDEIRSIPGFPFTLNDELDTLIVEEVGTIKSLPGVVH